MPREIRRIAQVTQLGSDTTDFQIQVFLALPSLIFSLHKANEKFPCLLRLAKDVEMFLFLSLRGLSFPWLS